MVIFLFLTVFLSLAPGAWGASRTSDTSPAGRISEVPLEAGATLIIHHDSGSGHTTYTLSGLVLRSEKVTLEFIPVVIRRGGERGLASEVRFRGVVQDPVRLFRPAPGETVMPVETGSGFIRVNADRLTHSFFREHAFELVEAPDSPDILGFEARFGIEPPVLEMILGASEVILIGENPVWRLQMEDSQRAACRRFSEIVRDR